MFNVYHIKIPYIFEGFFTQNHNIHDHNTRIASHFHIPCCSTNFSQTSIRFQGAIMWNKILKANINPDCSEASFKQMLKKCVLQKHHQLGKRLNDQTIKSVIKHVIILALWVHNTEMDTCVYIHPGWNFTALSITHLHPALVNFIKIELCSRYGAHKPNAGFLPPFAICVVECYILSADIALLYICLITIHVSYHTWYYREVLWFQSSLHQGYTASIIGWFESAVVELYGGFFCYFLCAAQIVCHMFYFIQFNFNLLLLWQWNHISYMYVWHRWQIKNIKKK